MVHEIADSDDEAEYALKAPRHEQNAGAARVTEENAGGGESSAENPLNLYDPVPDIEFDQFCSPTQRLSSYDANQPCTHGPVDSDVIDSSTDRFLSAVAPVPTSSRPIEVSGHKITETVEMVSKGSKKSAAKDTVNKKRPRPQVEDGGQDASVPTDGGSARKKSRIHGSSAIIDSTTQAAADFKALFDGSNDSECAVQRQSDQPQEETTLVPADMVSVEARTQYTSPLDLSLHLSHSHDRPAEDAILRTRPPQSYDSNYLNSAPNTFFGARLKGGTANRSSMGDYHSYSIDPNALGMGFDEINPFGSLSQVSLGGDVDSEETRGIAEIFRNSALSRSTATLVETVLSVPTLADTVQDMQTSPVKVDQVVDLPEILIAEEQPPTASPLFSPITNPEDQKEDTEADIPPQPLDDLPPRRRTDIDLPQPSRKKRGEASKLEKAGSHPVLEDYDDIDELQLDEVKLARAVRASTVDSVSRFSDAPQPTTTSKSEKKRKGKKAQPERAPSEARSKKLPSSDLGLDNKAIIGLSPERYVPRPSRRRAQSEPEPEFDLIAQSKAADVAIMPQALNPTDDDDEDAPTKPKSGKSRKGRKKKATQVKVDIPTLPKTSEHVKETSINEREEVKGEEILGSFDKVVARADGEDVNEKECAVTINGDVLIGLGNVPALTKPEPLDKLPLSKPEPKKRGKKRKTKPENSVPIEAAEEEIEHQERAPLAERDANMPAKKGKSNKTSLEAQKMCPNERKSIADVTSKCPDEMRANTEQNMSDTEDKDAVQAISTPKPLISMSKAASENAKPDVKSDRTTSDSPLTQSPNPLFNTRARIGLSKRHSIPSLLRRVDRSKEAPKVIEKKEKLTKRLVEEREQERIAREEAEAEGREYVPADLMRGKDGMLVEWDF